MGLARGAWLLHPLRVVTDNYAGPALLQLEWVSLLQGTDTSDQAKGYTCISFLQKFTYSCGIYVCVEEPKKIDLFSIILLLAIPRSR